VGYCTETPTTAPQGRGKTSALILPSDICLLYIMLRMQLAAQGYVVHTVTYSQVQVMCLAPVSQ